MSKNGSFCTTSPPTPAVTSAAKATSISASVPADCTASSRPNDCAAAATDCLNCSDELGAETRIQEQPTALDLRHHRAEKLQTLAAKIAGEEIDAGGLARPVHALDQACAHRILANEERPAGR